MCREKAIAVMKDYFGEVRFTAHTMKVLSYAERIYAVEGMRDEFVRHVVTLGSIFHDIGIPESLKKYSSLDAQYQEREGPAVARRLMAEIGVRSDVLERVCYIVGNHHSRQRVDGIDFQIIWEADFLVNVQEGTITIDDEELPGILEINLKTCSSRKFASEVLDR